MAAEQSAKRLPIGIFDSGVGGLTVLAALCRRLPKERFCYLGDTARLPYGTKSTGTIARYSLQATEQLVQRRIKLLVVACNTATAAALQLLQQAYAPLPVVGVVEPGAKAACAASKNGHILVLGTESTIKNAAYTHAIQALRPGAVVTGVPCSLFVPLAEEGWLHGPIAEAIAARYLEPILEAQATQEGRRPDCAVLGCTHFPPLAPAIRSVTGAGIHLVDSADTTAEAVEQELVRLHLLHPESEMAQPASRKDVPDAPSAPEHNTASGTGRTAMADAEAALCLERLQFLTTDAPARFARVGSLFLGLPLRAENLELVTL